MIKNSEIEPDTLIEMFIKSIIEEIDQYPCLGLVSKVSNGSHNDMDYELFIKSTEVFRPMFKEIYNNKDNISVFEDLKIIGYKYEKIMFEKTNGINTQKGLIFHLSIWFFLIIKYEFNSLKQLRNSIKIFAKPLKKYIQKNTNSIGDNLYKRSKIKGAKFEAISGYKNVFKAYKHYIKVIDKLECEKEYKYFLLLLYVTSKINDTTLINKIGIKNFKIFRKKIKEFLKLRYIDQKQKENILFLSKECEEKNISPGGSADLVVLILFLIKIDRNSSKRENSV